MSTYPRLPVLVGIDGGDGSLTVVRFAAVEARLRQRSLHLVCAFEPPPADALPDASWPPRDRARRRMMSAATVVDVGYPGVTLDARMLPGDLAELLVDRSRQVDCVVVSSQGAAGPHKRSASTAERVAAYSAVPAYVVPEHAGTPGGPVLVAVAGDGTAALLGHAFGEAASRGVPLRAVYVWTSIPDTGLGTLDPFAYDEAAAIADSDRVLAEALAGWQEKYPDVEVQRRTLSSPSVERAMAALSAEASVVVVGARSHAGRSEQLLGPVTRGLLRDARCPVVVVRTTC
jgi:nucleotide-binding universal stress UspA family protein